MVKPLAIFTSGTAQLRSAVFSPDGQRILTAADNIPRLWGLAGK